MPRIFNFNFIVNSVFNLRKAEVRIVFNTSMDQLNVCLVSLI